MPSPVWAFALLGPSTPADGQGADATYQTYNNEFRWAISTVTYSFDDSFSVVFGDAGANAVRRAFTTWDNAFTGSPQDTRTLTGSNLYDFETVALHELGHAMGIHHPDQAATFNRNFDATGATKVPSGMEVMDSQIERGEVNRTLTADDLAGFQYLYNPSNRNFTQPHLLAGVGDLTFSEQQGVAAEGTGVGANIDIFAVSENEAPFNGADELAIIQIAWVYADGTDGPGIINGNNIQVPADVLVTVAGVDLYFNADQLLGVIGEPVGAVPVPPSLLLMASAVAGLFVFMGGLRTSRASPYSATAPASD